MSENTPEKEQEFLPPAEKNELQAALESKFDPKHWAGFRSFRDYVHSGVNLIDEINALDPDLVIDVGCGHNRFKGHIKNLIGFDQEPFPFVDIVCPTEYMNFRPGSADVVMCLGSVQFGDSELVYRQMDRVVSWVKPGGFIVMRTMRNHYGSANYTHRDAHYIWDQDDIDHVAQRHDLTMVKGIFVEKAMNKDRTRVISDRLVWWWQKPGQRQRYQIDPVTCGITERE